MKLKFTKPVYTRHNNDTYCVFRCEMDFSKLKSVDTVALENFCGLKGAKYDRKKSVVVFYAVGITKLAVADEFDEILGKRIAESKAKIAAYGKAIDFLSAIVNTEPCMNGFMSTMRDIVIDWYDLDSTISNLRFYRTREQQHVKELIG